MPLFERDALAAAFLPRLRPGSAAATARIAATRQAGRPGRDSTGRAARAVPGCAEVACAAGSSPKFNSKSSDTEADCSSDSPGSRTMPAVRSALRSLASRWAISSREPNSTTVRPRLITSPGRSLQSWTGSPLTLVPLVLSRSVSTSLPSSSWIFRWKRLIRSSLSWMGFPSSRPIVRGVGISSKMRPRSAPSRIRKVIRAMESCPS